MVDEFAKLQAIADDLDHALVELGFHLEMYYDGDLSSFEKDIFVGCKICQQNALNCTKNIQEVVKLLRNNN